jgi:hypothetical protein
MWQAGGSTGGGGLGDGSAFSLAVRQNRYLSTDDREMHAIVRITAGGLGAVSVEAAEVILVDCSGSMSVPSTKIAAARRATRAAIDVLREGTFFAVVAGTETAHMVYPPAEHLVAATPVTRAEARAAAGQLTAMGGTAISTWLALARQLMDRHPAAVRHVLLLTDGKNETEKRGALDKVLGGCKGRFRCDARGIGDGWDPKELRRIVDALLGDAAGVRDDSELAADFRATLEAAMGRVVRDARLRVRCTQGVRVLYLKQTFPTQQDLAGHRIQVDERAAEFATGSWGDETRDYHLCLEVDAAGAPMLEDLSLARVELAVDGAIACAPVPVLVHWTDDDALSVRIDESVAHYTKQDGVRNAVVAGCDAYDAGDRQRAQSEWGRAVRLAYEVGNEAVLERLRRLVRIVDAAAGRVELVQRIDLRDLLGGETVSYTNTAGPAPPAPDRARHPPDGPDQTCSRCGRVSHAAAAYCPACGEPLDGSPAVEPSA